jgi:cytochrome c oxidase subunit II
MRRRLALAIPAGALLALVLAGPAFADALTPESGGSPNADKIDTLYKTVMVVAIFVFLLVEGLLAYCCIKFRARKGAIPAQIHGNTRLEIGWTVAAAVILVVLAVITFVQLDSIRTPPNSDPDGLQVTDPVVLAASSSQRLPPSGLALNICVNGQQYLWRYTYSQNCEHPRFDSVFAYEEMVVPTGTTVTLDIVAQDVAHAWWIPRLGGKFDAVPGYHNYTWFKVPKDKAGHIFTGQCAELCGRNHANMTARVKAVTPVEFEQWLARQKADIAASNQAAEKRRQELEAEISGAAAGKATADQTAQETP